MFAHTGGEDDDVYASHCGGIGTDVLLDAVVVHVECEGCTLVSGFESGTDFAHVAAHAADTEHSALLVQQVAHLVGGEAFVLHNLQHGAGVGVTAAGSHHQTFEGCESHGGVDALSAVDGADAGTVTDVAGDNLLVLLLHAEEFAHAVGDETVAGAVGTVAADLVLLVIFIGNGVHVCLGRHGLMEGGVEDEHLGKRGKQGLDGFVTLEVCGIVEGCEVHVGNPFAEHLLVHESAFGKASSGHDAVSGGGNLVDALDGTVLGMEQGVEHHLDAFGVCGAFEGDNLRLAVDLRLEECAFKTDFLDSSCGEDALVVHFVELVLDGARAAVYN